MARSPSRWFSLALLFAVTHPQDVFAQAAAHARKPAPQAAGKGTASSAPKPSAADAAEGKRQFELGLKLFHEAAFEPALSAFEESYRVGHRPSALKNVAQTNRELKRFAEAYMAFDSLLTAHGGELKPAERDEVQRALDDLKLLTGTLEWQVNEADAAVSVDGKKVGGAVAAAPTPMRLSVGEHRLRVEKPGFEPWEQSIGIAGDQARKVEVTLQREVTTGHVSVRERTGAAVRVLIDDQDVGPAPWEGDLAPGSHTLELKGASVAAAKRPFEVAVKARVDLVLDAAATQGRLRVSATPVTSKIAVDGVDKGVAGAWEGDLAPGPHEVVVTAQGYVPERRAVTVAAGQALAQDIVLASATPSAAAAQPERDPYKGIYVRWTLAPLFPGGGVPWPEAGSYDDPALKPGTEQGIALAGGTRLDIGYNLGIVSIEGVGAFMGQTYGFKRRFPGAQRPPFSPTVDSNIQRDESYRFISLGAFGGLGARVTSRDELVRFTAGAAFGVSYRHFAVNREISGSFDRSGSGDDGYNAFGMMFDAGILIGSTPGVKFTLGGLCWIDFPGSDWAEPRVFSGDEQVETTFPRSFDGRVPVSKGTNVFLGPMLGMQFGR